ncbi:MAG: RNA 2',3'-cyclic phosphodiesterase, partial [Clostridia bacterium]
MRLFIALPLPTSVCNALEKSCNQLKPHLEKGSIVSKQNYHITMHFLGEVSIDKIAYLQNALDHSAQECSAPTLSVNQLSTLSGAGIVCGKFKFDNKLTTLYDKLKSELDSIGFDTDNHKYTPH